MRSRTSLYSGLCTLSLVVASCDGTVRNTTDLPPSDTSDIFVPDTADVDTVLPDTTDTADTDTGLPDTGDTGDTNDTDTVLPDTGDTGDTSDTDADTGLPDTGDTTEVDTTPVDPCIPNPCTTPPDRCVGTTLERYTSPGTCTDDGVAQCDYALASTVDCAATNQVCSDTAKACVFPDLALLIETTVPANEATDVAADTSIAVTFNQPMNAATLTAQTTAGPCTGNLQLSFDGFTSCVAFTSASATLSDDAEVATLVPARPLSWGVSHALRIGANVAGGNGRTLGAAQTITFRTGPVTACGGARVVISQVYGGGGGTGVFSHDFVELKNRTATPVNLAGWSLQYGTNSGTSTWANRVLLDGVIPAGGYYLVQLGSSGANPTALPTADQTANFNIAQASGKVALVSDTTTLSGACPISSAIVDIVGYGGSNCAEGTPTPVATATTGVHRLAAGCLDTGDNLASMIVTAPRPHNSSSPSAFCGCPEDVEAAALTAVDYCVIQFPGSISVDHGVALPEIYGRVFEEGLTDTSVGQAPGIIAQLGLGPVASDPRAASTWVFFDTAFNVESGNDDEYVARVPTPTTVPPTLASFAYAYRMSLDGGATWTFCDLDGAGSDPGLGFDVGRLGRLDIGPNPCEPNPCTTPSPITTCEGDVIRGEVGPGVCSVASGLASCVYGTAAGTDCATLGDRCLAGACVECLTTEDCEGALEVCDQNTCVEENPCAPNPCTETRTPACDGNTLVTPASPGVCTLSGENASCDYDTTATRVVCPAGCASGACLTPTLSVTATTPGPAAIGVDPASVIHIDFSAAIDPSTATVQATPGVCSGNLQLSYDGFTSCVALTATVAGARVTLTPSRILTHGLSYSLRVTTDLASTIGGRLSATNTSSFSTPSALGSCGALVTMAQVYGGGGNSGAPFTNDYVVLRNRTSKTVALDGWSLQYTSATGTNWGTNNTSLALSGTIAPGGRFLVQLAAGSTASGTLPTADQAGPINLSATQGKVALVTGTQNLSQVACPDTGRLIDFLAYGTASECGTFGRMAALTNSTAAHRDVAGCVDRDTNTTDFVSGPAVPVNSTAPATFCACSTETAQNETDSALEVGFCNLQSPATLGVAAGATTPEVYGRVFQAGVTEAAGAAPGIRVQLGYGRSGVSPVEGRDWVFFETAFNVQAGNDDEHRGVFAAPYAPDLTTYGYTYRVSLDAGATWTYCDKNGAGRVTGSTFEASELGVLTIGGSACNPNPCTTPGPAFCSGDIIHTPTAPGTCTLAAPSFECNYPSTAGTDCATLGQRCEAGACVAIPVDRLVLEASDPADGATNVATDEVLAFAFDEALDPTTVTFVTATGVCAGNIQVSVDNFVTCLGLSEFVLADNDTSLLIAPEVFAYDVTYDVRITTGLRSVLGHQLETAVTQQFTTTATAPCDGKAAVISQVYAAGGASASGLRNDFVELKNRTGESLGLEGWSLQIVNGSGATRTVTLIPLRGTIAPAGHFLVELQGGALGTTLPTADQVGSVDLSVDAAVLLISEVGAVDCDSGSMILDRVSFGTSDCGTAPLAAPDATTSWTRDVLGCSAFGIANADFIRTTPGPKNGASPAVLCSCTDEIAVNDSPDPTRTALEMDYCSIQFPPSVAVMPGMNTADIYGQVFHDGLTTQPGQATGITAQLGFGPANSDPTVGRHWAFFDGTFNVEAGNNDEYRGVLPAPALASGNRSYSYVWRMSRDGGNTWTYCDRSGAGRGAGLEFAASDAGLMVVGAQCTREAECQAGGTCNMASYQCDYPALTVGYCRLHFPETAAVDVGGTVDLYGRVYIAGLTDRTPNANDPDALGRVFVQAGYGPTGAAPATFTWGGNGLPTPNYVGPGGGDTNNDEYRATFSPNMAGTFDMAVRFSGDGGATWLYCDKDGAVTAGDYSSTQAGVLTVTGSAQAVELYAQTFDGLPNSGTSSTLAAFAGALPGWAFVNVGTTAFQVGSGSGTAGGIYSFGAAAATERALGGLASNTTSHQNWAWCYTNNRATALTDLTVAYVGEQWRAASTTAQKLEVSYSTAAAVGADLAGTVVSDTDWTRVTELDFLSPILATTGPLDGNAEASRDALSHTFTGLSLPVGGTFCIRWRDLNDSGNDQGLAIDDLVITGLPQ